MGLQHRARHRVRRFAAILIPILLAAAPAAALDWARPATDRDDRGVHAEGLQELAPGHTVAWLLADGEVDWGTVAVVTDSVLITDTGLVLDHGTCRALWRAHRSRGRTMAKGVGYGLALGALASTAIYANFQDDTSGEWGNFVVGIGIVTTMTGGLLFGLVGGAVASNAEYWQLVHLAEGADAAAADLLPNTDGSPRPYWLRAPWVEISPALGATGWNGTQVAENQDGLRTAIWLPASARLDLGVAFGFAESSSLPGSSNLSAAFLLRLGGRTGPIQPYLTTGAGWYGPLGDRMGFTFGGGLRVQFARRWAVSLEAGASNAFDEVDGDRPGRAWLGIGIGHSLGTARPAR